MVEAALHQLHDPQQGQSSVVAEMDDQVGHLRELAKETAAAQMVASVLEELRK